MMKTRKKSGFAGAQQAPPTQPQRTVPGQGRCAERNDATVETGERNLASASFSASKEKPRGRPRMIAAGPFARPAMPRKIRINHRGARECVEAPDCFHYPQGRGLQRRRPSQCEVHSAEWHVLAAAVRAVMPSLRQQQHIHRAVFFDLKRQASPASDIFSNMRRGSGRSSRGAAFRLRRRFELAAAISNKDRFSNHGFP